MTVGSPGSKALRMEVTGMRTEERKARNAARIKELRDRRRSLGLCAWCGGETDGVHKMCFACRLKYAAWQADWQKKRRAEKHDGQSRMEGACDHKPTK